MRAKVSDRYGEPDHALDGRAGPRESEVLIRVGYSRDSGSGCGPTMDQLRQEFGGDGACECDTREALDFSTLRFGTRRTVVQIHSPRPFLLRAATYDT
jgi:hypothetical protein